MQPSIDRQVFITRPDGSRVAPPYMAANQLVKAVSLDWNRLAEVRMQTLQYTETYLTGKALPIHFDR
jgi:hypothetical protein